MVGERSGRKDNVEMKRPDTDHTVEEPVVEREVEEWEMGGTLAADLFEFPAERIKMTRWQKREQRKSYRLEHAKDGSKAVQSSPSDKFGGSSEELCQLQESDSMLEGILRCVGFF